MQLIVLGMHRSGTSILARTLNLMGAYFGAEGSGTGANVENPKGFWERRDVRTLNDAVLHAAGADWNRIARFNVDALPEKEVEAFVDRASRLVLELDGHRPWFIKEPRLCLLLPLWLRVLEAPVVVQVHRHPVEVAASLQTRNAIPIPAGLALWEAYVRAAARGAHGLPVARVSHRRLVTEPVREVERLYQQLVALDVRGVRMPSEREITAFVDQGLYRERESRDDLHEYSGTPQVALFEEIEGGAQPVLEMSDSARQPLRDYEATLPPLQPRVEASKPSGTTDAALHERVGAREQEAKLLRETVSKLESMLQRRDENLSTEKVAVARMEAEATATKRDIARLQGEAGSLRTELEARDARLATLADEMDASRKRATQAEAALVEREAKILSLQAALVDQGAKASSLQAELAGALQRGEDFARRTERTERSLEARFGELASLTRLLLDREADVEQARHDLAASTGQLRVSALELEAARADLARIHASRTWRLASPLRALARKTRRGSEPSHDIATDLALVEQSGLFDKAWYLEAYPDVAVSGIDPLQHYLEFGASERRSPGPGFNVGEYLRLNPDVAEVGMNPLVHYIRHGRDEGRRLA